jgi:hypothetical protein
VRPFCFLSEELHGVKVAMKRILASTRPVSNALTFHVNLTLYKLRNITSMTGASHNIWRNVVCNVICDWWSKDTFEARYSWLCRFQGFLDSECVENRNLWTLPNLLYTDWFCAQKTRHSSPFRYSLRYKQPDIRSKQQCILMGRHKGYK